MLLTIAILSGLNYIIGFLNNVINEDICGVNWFNATILILSVWQSCFPLAIIIIVITVIIEIIGGLTR